MASQQRNRVLWAAAAAVVVAAVAVIAAGPWHFGSRASDSTGAAAQDELARPALADRQPAQRQAATAAPVTEVTAAALVAEAEAAETVEAKAKRTPDVVYVPTPQPVVDAMLKLAEVKKTDVVYDLGCGDGRIVVTAAKKYGCKAQGFDIDPQRVKESLANVKKNKVEELVTVEEKDIFTLDLSEANVVTLYLLPRLNVQLIPQLEKLKPGSRIVSHSFDMRGIKPNKVIHVESEGDIPRTVYLWITPLEKEKE